MTLTWNPRPHGADGRFIAGRNEGEFRGFVLTGTEHTTVYQFGWGEDRNVQTVIWTGLRDHDGQPLFRHVDDPKVLLIATHADWFGRLNEDLKLVDPDGLEI